MTCFRSRKCFTIGETLYMGLIAKGRKGHETEERETSKSRITQGAIT